MRATQFTPAKWRLALKNNSGVNHSRILEDRNEKHLAILEDIKYKGENWGGGGGGRVKGREEEVKKLGAIL